MSYYGEEANITGNVSISSNLNVGTLRINSGTITDTSGVVDFGGDNVLTTGSVGIGVTNPNYSLDTLFTTTNTGFTTDTISAIFQTTTGGGKHGVAIGGDVISGNGFIQTIFNNINFGYNLCLQPHSGNVGIRTTSPTTKLNIEGTRRILDLHHTGTDSCYFGCYNDNITFYAGADGVGFTGNTDRAIIGTWSDSHLTFHINSNEKMRIHKNGNVGIGTDVPQTKLDVRGSVSVNNLTLASGSITDSSGAISFGDENISTTGNVGIETTSPTQELDVNGIVNVRDKTIGGQINGQENYHIDCYNSGSSLNRSIYLNYYSNSGTGWSVVINGNPSPRSNNQGLLINGKTRSDGLNIDFDCNHTTGSTNGASFFICRYNNTQIGDVAQSTTSSVVYNTTSDYRLKENVIEMPSMLNRINQLKPIQFNYLDDKQDSLGFIAHEFKEIFSNNAIVSGDKDDAEKYQSLDYGKITPICIKGIQELSSKNTELENKVTILEAELQTEKNKVSTLETQLQDVLTRLSNLENK